MPLEQNTPRIASLQHFSHISWDLFSHPPTYIQDIWTVRPVTIACVRKANWQPEPWILGISTGVTPFNLGVGVHKLASCRNKKIAVLGLRLVAWSKVVCFFCITETWYRNRHEWTKLVFPKLWARRRVLFWIFFPLSLGSFCDLSSYLKLHLFGPELLQCRWLREWPKCHERHT